LLQLELFYLGVLVVSSAADAQDSFENADACSCCFVEFDRPFWFSEFLALFTSCDANLVKVGIDAFGQGKMQGGIVKQVLDAFKGFVVFHHVVFGLKVLGNFLGILGM
jgi:hypothetical protein